MSAYQSLTQRGVFAMQNAKLFTVFIAVVLLSSAFVFTSSAAASEQSGFATWLSKASSFLFGTGATSTAVTGYQTSGGISSGGGGGGVVAPKLVSPCPASGVGDVNSDGYVTSVDVTAVQSCIVELSSCSLVRADVNGDKLIDGGDVIAIENYLAGAISTFPACPKSGADVAFAYLVHAPQDPVVGEKVSFSYTITNKGKATATGVIAGSGYAYSCSNSGGGGGGSSSGFSLAPGEGRFFLDGYTFLAPDTCTFTFTVSSDSDIDLSNNKASLTITAKATPVVKEQVKCVFVNSASQQKCYSDDGRFGCSGVESCLADVSGDKGTKITWKSSCGGYAYTVIDGVNEYSEFECKTTPTPVCTDSDGGKNYYVKGSVTGKWPGSDNVETETDGCCVNCYASPPTVVSSSDTLVEVYCNSENRIVLDIHKCDGGCKKGVCLSNLTVKKSPCPVVGVGDMNSDGYVTSADVTAVQSCIAGLSSCNLQRADVNADSVVDLGDTIVIEQYINGAISTFPACSEELFDLSQYPYPFVKDSKFNAIMVVGDQASSSDVIASIDIASSLQLLTGSNFGAKLASEVADYKAQNVISVGAACANAVTSDIMGNPENCAKGVPFEMAAIKLFDFGNGHVGLVVAGYNDMNTRRAGRVLADYKTWQAAGALKGTEVWVKGTTFTDIAVIPPGKEAPCGSPGDLNNDGYVTDADVTAIQNCIVRLPSCTSKQGADVNADGLIDMSDVLVIKQYLAGAISTFPACSQTACTDSDGGINLKVQGTASGPEWGTGNYVSKSDYCVADGEKKGRLAEFYCASNGQVSSITYGPENGCAPCINGACIKEVVGVVEVWQFSGLKLSEGTNPNNPVNKHTLHDVKPVVTSAEMPLLLSTNTLSNANGDYSYMQSLNFDEKSAYVAELENPDTGVAGTYLYIKNADQVARYELKFKNPATSKITVNSEGLASLNDFEGKNLVMLGKTWTVVRAKTDSTHSQVDMTLLDAAIKDVLNEGETKTYTIGGKDYKVTLDYVGSTSTRLTINGEITDLLKEGYTQTLKDGTQIYVSDIFVQEFAGGVRTTEFYLGADKVRLRDTNVQAAGGEQALEFNSETIGDTKVMITGTSSTDSFAVTSIQMDITADEDLYVPVGGALSGELRRPQALLGSWDIKYAGLDVSGLPLVYITTAEPEEKPHWEEPVIDLANYPYPFIKDGKFNALVVLGDQASPTDVYTGIDLAANLQYLSRTKKEANNGDSKVVYYQLQPISVGSFTRASEVADIKAQNALVLGGPCANAAAAELMGNPVNCAAGFVEGKAFIRLFDNNNGKVALLVAGYSALDTKRALFALQNYDSFGGAFRGKQIDVIGEGNSVRICGYSSIVSNSITGQQVNDGGGGGGYGCTIAIPMQTGGSCSDGSCAGVSFDLKDYPVPFEQSGKLNSIIVVSGTGQIDDVIAAMGIAASLQYNNRIKRTFDVTNNEQLIYHETIPFTNGIARLDSEVNDINSQNIISVGNACTNAVTWKVSGSPNDCKVASPPSQVGRIRLVSLHNGEKTALVIDGDSALDTRKAARVLANYQKWQESGSLKGQQVFVTGTLVDPVVTPSIPETPPSFPPDNGQFTNTVMLTPGWNLIGRFIIDGTSQIDTACTDNDILAAYYYDPVAKKYVDMLANNDWENSAAFQRFNSFWIKMANSCKLNLVIDKPYAWLSETQSSNLARGWNMLSVIPDMAGHTFDYVSGSCSVTRAYGWNADTKTWGDINRIEFDKSAVGYGFIVKVADDCALGYATTAIPEPVVSSPPEFPT